MWELDYKESWALKNWYFWTVVLEKTLESRWTARRSNQSILKEISPEYTLEGLMLNLKLQYFGHWCKELTHWKRLWCWERLKVGGEGDDRGWDGWMASLTWWTWVCVSSRSWWWTGKPGMLQSVQLQRVGQDWVTPLNWTDSLLLKIPEGSGLTETQHGSYKLQDLASVSLTVLHIPTLQSTALNFLFLESIPTSPFLVQMLFFCLTCLAQSFCLLQALTHPTHLQG